MRHSRGLKKMPVGSLRRGVPGGPAGRFGPCPPPTTSAHRVLAGVERVAWAAGPRGGGQPPIPNPPRRPRAAAQTLQRVKFPVARGAGDTRTAGGSQPGPWCGRTFAGRWALWVGWRGRRASPSASAAACVSGLTFVRARAASAAKPSTRVFCNQSVRLIKGGATAS